jgi:hypothetical protein
MPKNVAIDDDPELEKIARENNAKLAEEIKASGAELIDAEAVDPTSAEGLDLSEDLARLDEANGLGEVEEFSDADLEIKPAETLADFRDAIAQAQINGVTSIQASRKVIFHFTKPHYPENGFFHYQGVRVDEVGKTEQIEKWLNRTTEEVIFGKKR